MHTADNRCCWPGCRQQLTFKYEQIPVCDWHADVIYTAVHPVKRADAHAKSEP